MGTWLKKYKLEAIQGCTVRPYFKKQNKHMPNKVEWETRPVV